MGMTAEFSRVTGLTRTKKDELLRDDDMMLAIGYRLLDGSIAHYVCGKCKSVYFMQARSYVQKCTCGGILRETDELLNDLMRGLRE